MLYLLALLGVSAGFVFRGLLVGVGLIMAFEVEYCLTVNSVNCRIYECFVEFYFVYWTEFAFDCVGTRLHPACCGVAKTCLDRCYSIHQTVSLF